MNIVININMLPLVYHPKYILPLTDDLIKWFTFINNGTHKHRPTKLTASQQSRSETEQRPA